MYSLNKLIRIRYVAVNQQSGLTDLLITVTNPNGIDSSPVYLTEIVPGIYEGTFIPDIIGYWYVRLNSISNSKNSKVYAYNVIAESHFNATLIKGDAGLGITEQSIGFTLAGGITPKTLTVIEDAVISGQPITIDDIKSYSISDDTVTATTSTSYTQKLRLVVIPIITANYILHWSTEIGSSTNANIVSVLIQQNDSINIVGNVGNKPINNLAKIISGIYFATLTSGATYNFDIDFKSYVGTAYMRNARMVVSRLL